MHLHFVILGRIWEAVFFGGLLFGVGEELAAEGGMLFDVGNHMVGEDRVLAPGNVGGPCWLRRSVGGLCLLWGHRSLEGR